MTNCKQLGNMSYLCSHKNMMIHPEIRNLVKPSRSIDTRLAVDTITQRVLKALNRYEITREALPHEDALGTLPLFPEDTFHKRTL
jgi:hypothetical protein